MNESENGTVTAVSISTVKGVPKANVEDVLLIEDWGIEGDAHAGGGKRQVSLLAWESIRKIQAKGLKVGPGSFAENITTQMLDVPSLAIGDRLSIGEAVLEITQVGKECRSPCAIGRQSGECVMPTEGVFARVVRGGLVKPGDLIAVFSREKVP